MYKIYITFKIIKNGSYLDVVFDKRLSFKDNFNELISLYEFDINIDDLKIYDPYKRIMLDSTKPLIEYCLGSYRHFLVY